MTEQAAQITCPQCGNTDHIQKAGWVPVSLTTDKQQYRCPKCRRRFVAPESEKRLGEGVHPRE